MGNRVFADERLELTRREPDGGERRRVGDEDDGDGPHANRGSYAESFRRLVAVLPWWWWRWRGRAANGTRDATSGPTGSTTGCTDMRTPGSSAGSQGDDARGADAHVRLKPGVKRHWCVEPEVRVE